MTFGLPQRLMQAGLRFSPHKDFEHLHKIWFDFIYVDPK